MPESWAANSFKKLHESLGLSGIANDECDDKTAGTKVNNHNVLEDKNKGAGNNIGNLGDEKSGLQEDTNQASAEGKLDPKNDTISHVISDAFMKLTYSQKDVCVGSFWEKFCQEARNQGISPASFATFLGARAAIPGPSAPQGAWGQFSSGNRSVLDTFRKLRFGKPLFCHIKTFFFVEIEIIIYSQYICICNRKSPFLGELGSPEKSTTTQRAGISIEPDHWSLTEQQQEGLTRPTTRIFSDSKSTICQCLACGKVIITNVYLNQIHTILCKPLSPYCSSLRLFS